MVSFSHNYLFFCGVFIYLIIYYLILAIAFMFPSLPHVKLKQANKNTLFFFGLSIYLFFSYNLLSILFCLFISNFMVKRGHAWTLWNNNCICGLDSGITCLCPSPPPPLCPTNILFIKISSAICFQNRCGEGTVAPLISSWLLWMI